MPMPRTTLFSFSLCTLLATAPVAQEPSPEGCKANARAEARASADGKSSDSSRSSQTVTHRVVVKNGQKIVDERIENGKPAPADGGGGAGLGGLPPLPALDADEMLRRLREQVEEEVGLGRPPIPAGGKPLDARRASDRASDSASDSSKKGDSSKSNTRKDSSTKGSSGRDSQPATDRGRLSPRTHNR
jgi:hypothetical protein